MKPDTKVRLGDFVFSKTEIPEKIRFGGKQALAVHELVGGVRVVDAMGRQDAPIEWSGLFFGEEAIYRALYLDGLRISGKELRLRWGEFDFQVVIESFTGDYERFYQVPYSITCMVVKDNESPIDWMQPAGIDDLITNDMATANGLGAEIGDSALSGLLGTLDTAIKGVSSFANAAQSTINSVLGPIGAVQSRINVLTASVGNTIRNVTTLGGVLPNNPVAKQASGLLNQVTAMTQSAKLYNLQSVIGRMAGNLNTVVSVGKKVVSAGANLYKMAADKYGDASEWTTIAAANKLSDPVVNGVSELTVPDTPSNDNGVMRA